MASRSDPRAESAGERVISATWCRAACAASGRRVRGDETGIKRKEQVNGSHARSRNVRARALVVRRRGRHRRVRLAAGARSRAATIGPDEWRAFRLLRGTYGQRQDADAQMLRIKIPQGILIARSARRPGQRRRAVTRAASDTSPRGRTSSSTSSSCTTPSRRCANWPRPASPRAKRAATRSATSPPARTPGVAADEPFDVTPYAEALTRYLLRHPLSSLLPRKFKIAFEGCTRRSHRIVDQRHRLDRADPDRSAAARFAASGSRSRAAPRR